MRYFATSSKECGRGIVESIMCIQVTYLLWLICSERVDNAKFHFLLLQVVYLTNYANCNNYNTCFWKPATLLALSLHLLEIVQHWQICWWDTTISSEAYPSNLGGYHWWQKSALNLTCNQELLATPSQDLCLLAHNYKFCSSEDATSPVLIAPARASFGACQTCDNSPRSPMHWGVSSLWKLAIAQHNVGLA